MKNVYFLLALIVLAVAGLGVWGVLDAEACVSIFLGIVAAIQPLKEAVREHRRNGGGDGP